ERVAILAGAVCAGLLDGAVLPVLKHMPGHGRARVDSHYACPRAETAFEELARTDFAPFRALAAMPWAMTAHIVYSAIDPSGSAANGFDRAEAEAQFDALLAGGQKELSMR